MSREEYIESFLHREKEYKDAIKHGLPRVAAARVRYMAKLNALYLSIPYKQALEDIISKYNCNTKYLRLYE